MGKFLLLFIWGGLCFSVLIYAGVVWLHQSGHQSPPIDGKWLLVVMFGGLALFCLILAGLVSRWIQTRFTCQVITWALCESVAIYGLVLGLVGFPVEVWGSFSGVSIMALMWHRPGRSTPHES